MASVTKSVDVEAPLSTVYNQWTQFEDFQQFMGGVDQITAIERSCRSCVAKGPGVHRGELAPRLRHRSADGRVRDVEVGSARRAAHAAAGNARRPGRARVHCEPGQYQHPDLLPGGQLHRTRARDHRGRC